MNLRRPIKRVLPRSLLGRMLLIIVTPAVLLQLLMAYTFYESHWNKITRRLAGGVVADIASINDMRRLYPDQQGWATARWIAGYRMDLRVSFEPGAKLNADAADRPAADTLERMLQREIDGRIARPYSIDSSYGEEEVRIDVELPDGVLVTIAPIDRLFSSTTYIFVAWTVGGGVILFTIAIAFMRIQVRSIRRLARAVDRFGKGRDVGDFKPEGAAEVRLAARAFGLMRARIMRQIAQRTEMLAGVSHDLRTPLTRMRLQLAMLGDGPDVENLKRDIAEMETMIGGYLEFARGEGAESMVETDVDALLADVIEGARRNGADVELAARTRIKLPMRANGFKRCIGNLVANAARYAGHVWVQARRDGDVLEITVDDDGPGIAEDRREDVFRPFYRIDASRNPKTGGVGLGLTIARDVARGHGGELKLAAAPAGGLRAMVRVPL